MSLLSALGPIGSIAGAVLGPVMNMIGVETANKQNERLMNQQNAYNAPSAVMGRLKAAGLNPNLVYGSGTATAPSAPAPTIMPSRAGDAASAILPALGGLMSIIKTQADTANVNADTANKTASNPSVTAQADVDTNTVPYRIQTSLDTMRLTSYNQGIAANNEQLSELQLAYQKDANPINLKSLATALLSQQAGIAQSRASTMLTNRNIDWQVLQNNIAKMGVDPNNHSDVGMVMRFLSTWLSRLGILK